DIAGDDDDRLTDRDQEQDRRRQEQVAEAIRAEQKVRVLDRRRGDDQHEREQDSRLASGDERAKPSRNGVHRAASLAEWVAANMTLSAVASARLISAVMWPSCTSNTRSAMPSTSG